MRQKSRFLRAIHQRGRLRSANRERSTRTSLLHHGSGVLAVVLILSIAVSAQQPVFTPPRAQRFTLPSLPGPNVVAGGEVMIELTVDRQGLPTRPILLRSTPPYTQMVLDAVMGWQFVPARAAAVKGLPMPVEGQVLVVGVFRPPSLYSGPTLGEPPRQLAAASSDVAAPLAVVPPVYPVNASGPGTLLFELDLTEEGQLAEARFLTGTAGFEGPARDALRAWKFRPALVRGRPARGAVYVLFGFATPIGLSPR